MRSLLLILILTFSFLSLVKAENISDFQIEGLSIGDSLLDHVTIQEIKIAEKNSTYYKDNKYAVIFLNKSSAIYELIQVTYNPSDKSYILEAVEGLNDYPNDMETCNQSRSIIIKDVINLVKDYDIVEDEGEHEGDIFGKSNSFSTWIYPKSGGYISITCTDYSEEAKKEKGWIDQLSVVVGSEKLRQFLMNEAYN
jgi:hypothetical protein